MAEVQLAMRQPSELERTSNLKLPYMAEFCPPSSLSQSRGPLIHLGTFSPVNENGSFEFDRVLKSGYVQKRTRRTKAWRSIYLVLRPYSLSLYKDQNESRLQHKINLADLTAVALLKDPKQKRHDVFGLFSPSRNYHMEAMTRRDAQEWVRLISREARIEEEEEELLLASPEGNVISQYTAFDQALDQPDENMERFQERLVSSSPEPTEFLSHTSEARGTGLENQRRPSHTIDYSGNEISDLSDGDMVRVMNAPDMASEPLAVKAPSSRPIPDDRNMSQLSGFNVEQDPERVVWQGYLLYLKTSAGVRQWKDLWTVLRPRSIALYKNDSEYAPLLIIPLTSVINAVEIDPLSRTKRHCLQIITEEKSYKFCAHNEELLDKSLGAFKSLLAKRKDNY